jgi:hypothetical protein
LLLALLSRILRWRILMPDDEEVDWQDHSGGYQYQNHEGQGNAPPDWKAATTAAAFLIRGLRIAVGNHVV